MENVGEKVSKPRTFKSCVEFAMSLDGGFAVDFKSLMKWLISNLSDRSFYFDSEIPILLHPDAFQVYGFDYERVRLFNVWIPKENFSLFDFNGRTSKRFTFPAMLGLPAKQLGYVLDAVDKNSKLDLHFKLLYETVKEIRKVNVRRPDVCPKCGRATVDNQLPIDKRGKRGDRYKCVCGWRGKVKVKQKTVKAYSSKLNADESSVVFEVEKDGKEHFELAPSVVDDNRDAILPLKKFSAEAKVLRAGLVKLLKRIKGLSDNVKISVKHKRLTLSASSEQVRAGRFELGAESILDISGEAESAFDVSRLISGIPSVCDVITLNLEDKYLLLIEATPFTYGKIEVWQAPIIVSE